MIYIIEDYSPFPETSYIAAVIDTDVERFKLYTDLSRHVLYRVL